MHNVADLVVLCTVYTAEEDKVCEAFAVKDGKYVYVGDREGAESCIAKACDAKLIGPDGGWQPVVCE